MSKLLPILAVLLLTPYTFAADPATTAPTATTAPAPPAPNPREVHHPTLGLRLTAPEGWQRAPELTYSQVARFAKLADKQLLGLLEIDVVPAAGRTPKDVATKLAADRKATLGAEKPGPGGAAPFELRMPPTPNFAAGAAAVFGLRDQIVLVSVGATDAAAADAARDAVVSSMAVAAPTPAVDDLALRKRPVALFKTGILLALPEPFRPSRVKDPEREMFFGVRDWATARDEASLQIQLVPNPHRAPLAALVTPLAENLSKQLGLTTPITFAQVNDDPQAFLSTPFSTDLNDAQRIVQVALDDTRIAVLMFRTTAPDPAAREKYVVLIETVAKSLRTSKEYEEAARAATRPKP